MPAKKNANGEGSVYQRADGRWCGTAYVTTTDGTTKRVHVCGDTHREASANLAAKIADNLRGVAVVAKDPTLTVGDCTPGCTPSRSPACKPPRSATTSR